MSEQVEGYINETFEQLIERSSITYIKNQIRYIKKELSESGLDNERLRILTNRLSYCYFQLRKKEMKGEI